MLAMRKRGKVYHVRGTVRVGRQIREVKEHSTGCRERAAAEAYKANLEHEVGQELLHGRDGRARGLTLAEVLLAYVERPGGLPRKEVWHAGQLGDVLGDHAATDVVRGWAKFTAERCRGLAPATVNRFRGALIAGLNHSGLAVPKDLKPIRVRNARVRYLSKVHQEALLAAYAEHVRPIALVLAFQGARTQEALQLQWHHVDFARQTMHFDRTKTGEPRTVAMHPRVLAAIAGLWREQGEPSSGHVFLNVRGQPYADTREYRLPGGNPLRKAHATACRRVGVRDFTPHDWRHHWASWCVMSGVDLVTLKRMGGWASLAMVDRYAALDTEHMAAAVRKLA
jgi:integrase